MSIRDLAVAYDGGAAADAALAYAAAIAEPRGAFVTGLIAQSTFEAYAFESRYIPKEAQDIIERHNAQRLTDIVARFETRAATLYPGERMAHQELTGKVDRTLIRCARSHDILVMGNEPDAGTDFHFLANPDIIVLKSGRPVVVVPSGHEPKAAHSHAVVAWDGKRAAARALADALDLLEADGHVTLLMIGEDELPRPVEEVVRHLNRHGVEATPVRRPASGDVAEAILAFAAQTDPCVLVMGAFEHSKFSVDLFGGKTRRVIANATTPVMISY
ncbi:MAG: universal stress protein [Pseudomonadota bacterium]